MDGTPEQKAAWLPRMATARSSLVLLRTEPDSRSDAASLRTRGEAEGDHYVSVTGTKRYITNAVGGACSR